MLHTPHLKYPSKLHCEKVASHLPSRALHQSVLLAKGQVSHNRDNTDTELQFHQESNFFYLTGVDEADYFFVYHFASSTSYLVAPDIDIRLTVWKGPVPSNDELLQKFDIDHVVRYADLLHLLKNVLKPRHIYGWNQPEFGPVLKDKTLEHELRHYITHRLVHPKHPSDACTTNGTCVSVIDDDNSNSNSLYDAFVLARIHKSPIELLLSREATRISSDAHRLVMQHARIGMFEYQLEHLFRYECGRRGGRMQGYLPIVGRGVNAAYLHYTRNNERIQHGDLILIDAACEFEGYTSDVTRTFPVSGQFSKEQGDIYELVAEMQNCVLQAMKAGVDWKEMAKLSREIGLQGLKRLGIVIGNDEDLRANNIIALFYPHGLGHLLGLNVHDDGLGLNASQPPAKIHHKHQTIRRSRMLMTGKGRSSVVEIHAYTEAASASSRDIDALNEDADFLHELLNTDPLPPPSTRRHQRPALATSRLHGCTTTFATPGTLLEPGMLLTVEPGIYFSPLVLSLALKNQDLAQYLDQQAIQRYMSVGGVRIEDVVYIRSDGDMENITTAPKSAHEVEQIVQMAQLMRADEECQTSDVWLATKMRRNDEQQQRQFSWLANKAKRASLLKRAWRALKSLI